MKLLNDRYHKNPLLPKAGLEKQYDVEQVLELQKCIDDPIYFAETYFKIVHVDRGLIPFELYEYQKEAVEKFQNNRNLIICASRQSGKTSVTTVILLHTALFNKNKLIAILANKGATSREILKRVKTAYEYLPDFLKPGIKEWNKGSVEFENGSIIMAEASSSDNIRGKSVFLLYVDELAFVSNWEDFSASVLPTLSSGTQTKIVFSSTPCGLNHFFYYVKNARENKSNFALVEVPWWKVPGRDEDWKQRTLAELNHDEVKFAQEYAIEFQGSSGTLISGGALKLLETKRPITATPIQRQYVAPDKKRQYCIIADVSRGKGLDYSAFHVIDITTIPYNQVFVFRSNLITPTDYATYIQHIGILYNNAHILCEINDIGQQVIDIIHDSGYENIIYTKNNGRSGKIASQGFGSSGVDMGVRTTTTVKALGCSSLKLLVEQFKLLINDENTIKELNTFSRKGKSWEAEPGNNDDLVMGLVLFAWLTLQPFFKELTDTDILSSFREKTEQQLMDEMLPFGYILDGNEETVVTENFQTVDIFVKF